MIECKRCGWDSIDCECPPITDVNKFIDIVSPDHCRTTCIDGTGNNATGCTRCDLQCIANGGEVDMTLGSWYV